jgi:hypothetical protein
MLGLQDEEDIKALVVNYELDAQKGLITLPAKDLVAELMNDPEMQELIPVLDSIQYMDENSSEWQFLEMFFGGTMTTVIHAPGPIKKVKEITGRIEGKTISFKTNMLEELQKKEKPKDIIIKYRKPN